MATYFEKLPDDVIISEVEVVHNTPQYATRSRSGVTKRYDRGIHYLSGSMTLTATGDDGSKELEAFLLRMKGVLGTFKVSLGSRFTSKVGGIASVVGNQVAGANMVSIDGFSGKVVAGSAFTVLNDSKVYFVTNSGVSGTLFNIVPALRQDVIDNTQVDFTDVEILMKLTEDSQTVTYDEGGAITTLEISWEENLL